MEARTREWLFGVMAADVAAGFRRENLRFCDRRSGPRGKGPVAQRLGLTHFVDDNDECLWSVYCDPAGCAGEAVRRCGGQLFYFPRSGRPPPPRPRSWPDPPPGVVTPVAGWVDLLARLNVARGRKNDRSVPRPCTAGPGAPRGGDRPPPGRRAPPPGSAR